MNNHEVISAKASLDAILQTLPKNNSIQFGIELFDEFRNRGWFTLYTFRHIGIQVWGYKLHSYTQTHYVCKTLAVAPDSFCVK